MQAQAQQNDGPESFYCPISGELMKDPVVDPEGLLFCSSLFLLATLFREQRRDLTVRCSSRAALFCGFSRSSFGEVLTSQLSRELV
jgi:hypothetical protein